MTTSPYDLLSYYSNLLILQYIGLPRANATIQTLAGAATMPQTPSTYAIVFSDTPTSGVITVSFNSVVSGSINWDDSAATIQTTLRAITGLSSVTTTGAISDLLIAVTMTGVLAPAPPLVLVSNTLVNAGAGSDPLITEDGDFIVTEDGSRIDTAFAPANVDVVITETDQTIPLAVMNGYNLIGPNPAVGVQLDVIGEYAGVTRSAFGFFQQITLDDADFLSFIKLAIVRNNSGSSLAEIQKLLFRFFPGQILVFDYANMQMDYLIDVDVGSFDLLQLFVTEGLLPKPMGVLLGAIIYIPNVRNLFGFRTYELPGFNTSGFNNYVSYNLTWPWLSYANAIAIP